MLHIIGLLNGQNVKVKELPVSGYGVVTNDKMLYTEEEGYYTEIEYNNASDYQRTFTNYPLALSLTKKITNPENNAEVIEKSVFTFQLCKQDNEEYSPLTEAEMKKMRGYLLTSSTATKFEELTFFGSDGNEFNLKAGQTAVIVGTEPNTIYATKEISCTIDGVRSENSYQKKNNGITVLTSDSLQNTASQTYLTGTSTGTQENTYFPQNGLTISKLIENDYNHLTNPNAEYLFKIEKINGNNSHESLNNQQYKLNGVTQKTTTEQGYFTLKENEYAFFNLNPAEYKITEINPNKSYTQLNNIYNNYYSENNQTNTLTNQILFTTTYIVDGGESRELYAQNTSSENDNSAIVKFTGKEEQSISFTNHVIDKEYQFNIEKIIYRDKNAHGDTDDNEQRFVFRIDRYAIDADVNNLPKQSIETFYVTLNCPNPVEYEQNEKKYYLNHSEFELPLFGLDENTSFDSENQKITKTYTDSNEQYTYPASIWQGSVSTVVNRKGVYKVTEVTGWSATDYDYCKGSNTFKCAETVVHSDKSVNNTDYVAFKLEEDSEKTASFSNAESEFAYFSSSAYAINRIQAVQN